MSGRGDRALVFGEDVDHQSRLVGRAAYARGKFGQGCVAAGQISVHAELGVVSWGPQVGRWKAFFQEGAHVKVASAALAFFADPQRDIDVGAMPDRGVVVMAPPEQQAGLNQLVKCLRNVGRAVRAAKGRGARRWRAAAARRSPLAPSCRRHAAASSSRLSGVSARDRALSVSTQRR